MNTGIIIIIIIYIAIEFPAPFPLSDPVVDLKGKLSKTSNENNRICLIFPLTATGKERW